MYGSRKSQGMDPYRVTKVISSEGKILTLEEAFKNYELFDYLESPIVIAGRVKKFLPRILSIFHGGRQIMDVKEGLVCPLKDTLKLREKKKTTTKHLAISVKEALNISARLLPMLKNFRAEDRNEWMRVGWILNNIGKSSTEALEQWITFSARCVEQFDEATCVYQWEKMGPTRSNIGYFTSFG